MICKHCKRPIKLCASLYSKGKAHCERYVHSDDNYHVCEISEYGSTVAEPDREHRSNYFSDGSPIEIYEDLKDIHITPQFLGDWE